jgi:hypothetical protein
VRLAEGQFFRSFSAAGADVVRRPLGARPTAIELTLSRYEQAAIPAEQAV